MDQIRGDFYISDNQIYKCNDINFWFNTSGYLLYEVLRTQNGILIFLDEHLVRLYRSLNKLKLGDKSIMDKAKRMLRELVKANKNLDGNIKLIVKKKDRNISITTYYIPHSYPEYHLYQTGINLVSFNIQRSDPNIKQVAISESIRYEIKRILNKENIFEVLLVDEEGNITEGSKSNIFFIKENKLISARDETILPGITRSKVLEIAEKNNISILKRNIHQNEIKDFDAAILCGTSPKVIPVKKIDSVEYNLNNRISDLIIRQFNEMLDAYIISGNA